MADTARAAGDKDGLPRLQLRDLEEGLPSRQRGQWSASRFLMRQTCGLERQICHWCADILTIRFALPGKAEHAIHFIPWHQLRDP